MSAATKTCGRCRRELPLDAFNRDKDGRQHWCRACFGAYFSERGALHLRQARQSVRARRRLAKAHVLEILRRTPCRDCGERDPVVLEFDHVRPKGQYVSALVASGASPAALDREIVKCEVVCVACHRRRTAARRAENALPVAPTTAKRRRIHARLAFVRDALTHASCADCGCAEPLLLDFDHLGPKRAAVTTLAGEGYSEMTLLREIANCVVRCCICHRRRTARDGNHYRHAAVESGGWPP